MTSFNVSAGGLSVRPVQDSDLVSFSCEAGDLQTFEYMSNRNPAVRRFGSRQATGSSVAHALLAASGALNRHSLTVWVRRWLRENSQTISDRLVEDNHRVFIVQANYTVARTQITPIYMAHGIHLLGTVPDVTQIGKILTHDLLYGPAHKPQVPNNLHSFHSAYLVGQRTVADPVREFAPDLVNAAWRR